MTTVHMNSPFDRVYSRNVGYGCRCTGLGRALRLKRARAVSPLCQSCSHIQRQLQRGCRTCFFFPSTVD